MNTLVKGMKKPTACYKCPLRTGKYCGILTENEKCANDGILPHCPIIEISEPHGRLIDIDKIFNALRISKDIDDESKAKFMGLLLESPTVIESEEQEHEQ